MASLKSIADTEWVAVFMGMINLIEQDVLLDELTAIHNAGKKKRRQEFRTELEASKVKVKYRGPNRETWSGVDAMAALRYSPAPSWACCGPPFLRGVL